MKRETLKSVLAALGVLFILLVFLAIFLPRLSGGGGFAGKDKVGVIEVTGVILDSKEVSRQIKEFSKRNDIKAVVIRIDSPGGAVGPSQEIYREVSKLSEKKSVVASFGSVAASGGYYIALGADSIVSNPGSITGSIGVIVEFMNLEGLFEKIGLKGSVIKSGKFKDTGSPIREMSKEEKKLLQALIDDVHAQFVTAVVQRRKLDRTVVEGIADGRIFSGAQAKKEGLVDSLGGLSEAVQLASRMAGITKEPSLVYPKKSMEGIVKRLLDGGASSALGGVGSGLKLMYVARPFN